MSLTMPEPTPRRRGPVLAVVAVVVLALLVGGVYLLTRPNGGGGGATVGAVAPTTAGAGPPSSSPPPTGSDVQYKPSPSQQPLLPYSATSGPRSTDGGVAVGFAHTEQGAAMAIQHAIYEVAGTAPPSVYEKAWATRWTQVPPQAITDTQQSYASYAATTGATYGQYLTAPAGIGLFQGYLVTAGDGTTDTVTITTVVLNQALSGQPARWSGSTFALRWVNNDWVAVYSAARAVPFPGKPAGMTVL
jgi:hypothetical protein